MAVSWGALAIYYKPLLLVSFMPKMGCKFHKLFDVISHPVYFMFFFVGPFVNECVHV